MPDLRPPFDDRNRASIHPGLYLRDCLDVPRLVLDPDAVALLRAGLGRYDMEIRWLAHLDAANVLGVWRSWTGFQIYEAVVAVDADGTGRFHRLRVEQHQERYHGSLTGEPATFERVIISVINTLRWFRAGHTPYGAVEGADPIPSPWP